MPAGGALAGIKVVDFGWAWAGAFATKQLADNGATVVKVESPRRPDVMRCDRHVSISKPDNPDDKPLFAFLNTSKYSITVDLRNPKSRPLLERLIKWADVVSENFTPGTLDKLGYGYDYASRINPAIVYCSSSAYGQTGPMAREWGLDGTACAYSGRLCLTGWPDIDPVMPSCCPYADAVTPLLAAAAIVAGLDYRRRTGKGQYIDISMVEVLAYQIAPAFLAWQLNTTLVTRSGNRTPDAAPHGVFPCLGEDRWCAIAVFTEEEWQAFCRVVDEPWARDPKFETLSLRKLNEDELERLISNWTRHRTAEEVMNALQEAGVPAGVVQTGEDLISDPQLSLRQFLVPVEHPALGAIECPAPAYKLSKTRAQVRPAPCMGQHNEYVCTQLLGFSDEQFARMIQEGVFD